MKINIINVRRKLFVLLSVLVMFSFFFVFCESAFSSSGGSHGRPIGWVATDTYRIMCFVVLVGGLFFLLRKPVPRALNSRIEGIKDQLSDLETRKKEAEKRLTRHNENLLSLNQESEAIIAEYIKQGKEANERILKTAGATASKLEEQARRNIEHEFQKAKTGLQAEIIEKALVKAEQILKTKISSEDQARLVDDYLEKVVA